MKIIVHRGTHQIGGIATEISTEKTRILIDMGEELSLDPDFVPSPLNIPGVTDTNGKCDAVFFTHYHGDHTGQMTRIRDDTPLYAGALAKDIMLMSAEHGYHKDQALINRIKTIHTFGGGQEIVIGDIRITPWSIDHSACDSYLFLIEADGKRILYTGDFRMHGIRGKSLPKILRKIGKVDVVVTEGTTISRQGNIAPTEWELQQRMRDYIKQYKYVFLLCATTNLDRIFACARAVPYGKYSLCDEYQYQLANKVAHHWQDISPFYKLPKLTPFNKNPPANFEKFGGLMFVRANSSFEKIISQYDPAQSIILYSMWDGYRTKSGSCIPDFLSLTGTWETFHTSGHASPQDICQVIKLLDPQCIIPMHTDSPQQLQQLCPNRKITILQDGETVTI